VFAPKNLHQSSPTPFPSLLAAAALGLLMTQLGACSKPAAKAEDIRPVRVLQLTGNSVDVTAEFSGEVRPRIESRLGFRVGGKIISRKVDVGNVVRHGQVLMQLDPQDLQLAQAQASAGLRAAESTRDLALAELKRYQDLRAKNFVSQAVLDTKESVFKAAQASVDSAQAASRGQSNQTGYTSLVSDIDGIVTAVEGEVGQVVAAGTPVVRIAKSGGKEIVIGLPEDKVEALRKMSDVQVRLWSNPNDVIPGKIREVAPVADPLTRTYAVKVSIPDSKADVKLGMTALVRFSSQTPNAMIKVPLTALYHEKSMTSLWVVENGAVKLVPVRIDGTSGNDVLLAGGVAPGQTVVTAGVNLLKAGQKVRILGADPAAVAGATAGPGGAAK
jgi:membrane fusion protein, multidrug efflux system